MRERANGQPHPHDRQPAFEAGRCHSFSHEGSGAIDRRSYANACASAERRISLHSDWHRSHFIYTNQSELDLTASN